MAAYIMKKEFRAMFNKDGNIKLGNSWSFSMAMGNDQIATVYNGKYYSCMGTCGKYCQGCKNDCYVKKSYRYTSVKYSHIRNTNAMVADISAAFSDLRTAIVKARKKPDIIRINQSGEIINTEYLLSWCKLASEFKNIKFWMYTKAFTIVLPALNAGMIPDNMTILFSIWHEYGINAFKSVQHMSNVKAFVYCDEYDYSKHDLGIMTYCTAYKNINGRMTLDHNVTCDKCKKCFSRLASHKVIGCLAH